MLGRKIVKITGNMRFLILSIIVSISIIGVSYGFFNYYGESSSKILSSGKIMMLFTETSDTINLTALYPQTKEEARKRKDNVVVFNVSGDNTTPNKDIYYEILLNEGKKIAGKTRFKPSDLLFDLIEIDEKGNEKYVVEATRYDDFNARRIWVNTIDKNTENIVERTYKLRIWLSEDVLISDTFEDADYTTDEFANSYVSVKVSVFGDFKEKDISQLLSDKIEETISLTEADEDGTRFVTGNTVDDNYVWYSGKLWRIVSIDDSGNIKLVTQGNVTAIAWDTSNTNIDYSKSQIRKWLNDEFLPTLYNSDNLLADHEWDYTTYVFFPTSKITENQAKLTGENIEKVGLLNIYEYMMTGGTSSFSGSQTFLNNNYSWWTMSPIINNGLNIWNIYLLNNAYYTNPYIIKGDKESGTKTELLSNRISGEYINFNNTKYRIVDVETINGKQLTKVTMADYSVNDNNTIGNVEFGPSIGNLTYSTSEGVGKYLLDWYNAKSETDTNGTYTGLYISETYKKMIANSVDDGVYWWIGPTSGTGYDYKLSRSGTTISTPIGLGYYGEMFSSQFGEGYSKSIPTWLMTKNSDIGIWLADVGSNVYVYDYVNYEVYDYGVRPSFYLKGDVVIGDTNGDGKVGTGMPHDPYEIVQVSK